MNRNLSLVLVASAAVCGLAFAQVAQKPDAAAQIAALEKRVAALEADLTAFKAATPGTAEADAALAKDRRTLEAVVKYTAAQSAAAERLQAVLDDSQAKGFTFGINPDSRVVLLDGFHDFAHTLQTDAPKPEPVEVPKGKDQAKR